MAKIDLEELADFYEGTAHAERGDWLAHIELAILAGSPDLTMGLVSRALDDGVAPEDIAKGPMSKGMLEVGRAFKEARYFIPEVIMSTRAMNAALFEMRKRQPQGAGQENDPRNPTVLLGTVEGDFHDIGKNLASCMFQARGFQVIDLGVNVPAKKFAQAAKEHRPDVVGLSAMLTTTVGELGKVIGALEDAGIRDELEVYVSGVPVTQKLADEIGADKYCADLDDSLEYLEQFVLE